MQDVRIEIKSQPSADLDCILLNFLAPEEKFLNLAEYKFMQRKKEKYQSNNKSYKVIYVDWFDFDKDGQLLPEKIEKYAALQRAKSFTKIALLSHGSMFCKYLISDPIYLPVSLYPDIALSNEATASIYLSQKQPARFTTAHVKALLDFISALQPLKLSVLACQGETFAKELGRSLTEQSPERHFIITAAEKYYNRDSKDKIDPAFCFLNLCEGGFTTLNQLIIIPLYLTCVIQAARGNSFQSSQDITTVSVFISLAGASLLLSSIDDYVVNKIISKIPHINATKKMIIFRGEETPPGKYKWISKRGYLKKYGTDQDQEKLKPFARLDQYRQAQKLFWINNIFLYAGLSMAIADSHSNSFSTTLCYNLSALDNFPFPVWALLLLLTLLTNVTALCYLRKPQPKITVTDEKSRKIKMELKEPLLSLNESSSNLRFSS